MTPTQERALTLLCEGGFDPNTAHTILDLLDRARVRFADATRGEFVCRWVNVDEQAVPPEADTIIRTVTRSEGQRSATSTHWLTGIEAPPLPKIPA